MAAWAAAHGLAALHTVALYVTAQQDLLRPSPLLRQLAANAAGHRAAGTTPPRAELVRSAVAGLRRSRGSRPAAKSALVTARLTVICGALQAWATPPAPPRPAPAH
jgi:hypothetical protein